jgi:hypothetical protein
MPIYTKREKALESLAAMFPELDSPRMVEIPGRAGFVVVATSRGLEVKPPKGWRPAVAVHSVNTMEEVQE